MNEIVAAVTFRDSVFIFTRDGTIWRMYYDDISGNIIFSKMFDMFPR
jgi:hypothetical protein